MMRAPTCSPVPPPRSCRRSWRAALLIAVCTALAIGLAPQTAAAQAADDIRGVVLAIDGDKVTVVTVSPTPASVGGAARIYVVIPDIGEEAHVAAARVVQVDGQTVRLQVERATGTVAAGQQVSISGALAPPPAMPAPVAPPVPSVVGLPAAAAKATLAAEGLVAVFRAGQAAPAPAQAYTVYEQQPSAGSAAPPDRQVAVVMYSAAGSTAPVAPVRSSPQAEADSSHSGGSALQLASALDGATAADRKLVQDMLARLERSHASGSKLDEALARRWFDRFLRSIDGLKLYFTEADVAAFEPIVPRMSELARAGDLRFPYGLYAIYLRRVDQRIRVADELLSSPLDFTVDETYTHDMRQCRYARNASEARDLWRRRLKYDALRLEADGLDEAAARQVLRERIARLRRLKYRLNDTFLIEMYLNALCEAFDSESRYWSPMSAALISGPVELDGGIGVEIQWIDTTFEITRIAEGGPADRQGQLQLGDRIIGLGEATGAIENVTELSHVQLMHRVRGEVGSELRIEFQPKAGGEPQTVQLTREKLALQQATGEVLQAVQVSDVRKYTVGFIELPTFYKEAANGQAQQRSSTRDVRELLDQFRAKQVDAVVIDLRRNRGGPLDELIDVAGLFLPPGPLAQSKYRDGQLTSHDIKHAALTAEQLSRYRTGRDAAGIGTGWNGPLVVLVSRNSVGGAELLAGALQDYGRALIVGDKATYGMGLVNHSFQLGPTSAGGQGSWGMMRITSGMLYRPNGESAQMRGVAADVALSSFAADDRIGSSYADHALPTASTSRSSYERFDFHIDQLLRDRLAALSLERRESTAALQQLEARIEQYRQARARTDAPLAGEAFQQWYAAWENPFEDPEFVEQREAYRQEVVQIALDYASRLELARGQSSYAEGRYDSAWQQYASAVRLDPANAAAWHNFAWSLATCPDNGQRDAALAVEHATQACELSEWKHWAYLLTLAVAQAQAGAFDSASTRLDEALALAPPDKQTAYAYLRDRFKAGQGYAAK